MNWSKLATAAFLVLLVGLMSASFFGMLHTAARML